MRGSIRSALMELEHVTDVLEIAAREEPGTFDALVQASGDLARYIIVICYFHIGEDRLTIISTGFGTHSEWEARRKWLEVTP